MTLRPFTWADVPIAAAWGLDDELCRRAEWTVGLPIEEHRKHWESLLRSPSPELIRLAAVSDGELVGYVDLHGTDPDRRELGYVIGRRELWGRGLGTRAARAGLALAFDELGLDTVEGQALAANPGSVRILQRLGMIETGRGDDVVYLGRTTYNRQFMITRAMWTEGRDAGLDDSPAASDPDGAGPGSG
jgi:RimJ/RimL family protein N-acetyltransferase